MNISSLLFGSVAALVALSDARAVDAIAIAEPEPTQYVNICDVYGSGYFYVPGAESCLRLGGHVLYDIGLDHIGSYDGARTSDVRSGASRGTWRNSARFTFKTWTRQETELGTLRTYTETRVGFGNTYSGISSPRNFAFNRPASLVFAWIQLGGLRVGNDWSAFQAFTGHAGDVLNQMLVPSGGFETNLIQRYFDVGNGFSAVVSFEQGSGAVGTIDSYVPHVVGGLKYTQGWGAITGVMGYDSNYGSLAGKIRADLNVTNEFSLFGMLGYGSFGKLSDRSGNAIDAHGRGFYKSWGGNWALWAGATYEFGQKTSFNLQVSGDQLENYGLAANVAYTAVPGMMITAEIDFDHYGKLGLGTVDPWNVNWTKADSKNSVGGILRFQRSF